MQTLRPPPPLPHQRAILESSARFKVCACGRRWGKTTAALLASIEGHGAYRGQYPGVVSGARIWWVAPSYPQIVSSHVWPLAKRMLLPATVDKSEVEKTIYVRGGGSFAVRSADNESSLRGPGLDGIVLDEAAFAQPSAWHEVLRPSLADRRGWCMMISTPNGFNWFHDMWKAADGREWQAWQRPSADNPVLEAGELAKIRREIGERAFAQEHLAEFVAMEGAEWSGEVFSDIWPASWPQSFERGAIGVDPSKGKNPNRGDYAAVVYCGLSGGLIWVDARIERVPVDGIVRNVLDMYDQYRPELVGIEDAMNQDLVFEPAIQQAAVERFGMSLPLCMLPADANKVARILRLNPWLTQKAVRFRPDSVGCLRLEEQLRSFPLTSAHDDGPDAMEMAMRLLTHLTQGPDPDAAPEGVYV